MLLEHLGETRAAATLMAAIEAVTADRSLHTRDLGGTRDDGAGDAGGVRADRGRREFAGTGGLTEGRLTR